MLIVVRGVCLTLTSLSQERVPGTSARWALRTSSRAKSRTRERSTINELVDFPVFGLLLLAFWRR